MPSDFLWWPLTVTGHGTHFVSPHARSQHRIPPGVFRTELCFNVPGHEWAFLTFPAPHLSICFWLFCCTVAARSVRVFVFGTSWPLISGVCDHFPSRTGSCPPTSNGARTRLQHTIRPSCSSLLLIFLNNKNNKRIKTCTCVYLLVSPLILLQTLKKRGASPLRTADAVS